jgi:hypothetical protein
MAIIRYIWGLNPGGATGTPASFTGAVSNIMESASYYQEQTNITGAASAVVTLQVTGYNNISNRYGEVLVNGGQVVLNDVFTVTLDGSGNGSFISRCQGDPTQTGTGMWVVFTITGVSTGQVGTPASHEISKTF